MDLMISNVWVTILVIINSFIILGGIKKIQEHCMQLAERAYRMLTTKKHANGKPLAVIYGAGWKHIDIPNLMSNQAPTVAFNLLRDDGSFVGFLEARPILGAIVDQRVTPGSKIGIKFSKIFLK